MKQKKNLTDDLKVSKLDALENQLFENFYKSHDEQKNQNNFKKPDFNSVAEVFKRRLYEKLGLKNLETDSVLMEVGNKMWEIKKRLNNHMSYLKKKIFFEKLDEFFIQIIFENRMTQLKVNLKSDKAKIQKILPLLKPFIFSNISDNNMMLDGIKILFLNQKNENQTLVKKLKNLYRKIKSNLGKIIFESISDFSKKSRKNFQFNEIFPIHDAKFETKKIENVRNDSYIKAQQRNAENQFSDINMRRKLGNKLKSYDFPNQKLSSALSKTNINFPISHKKKIENLASSKEFKELQNPSNSLNIDKICYYYLDRLNLSGF